LRNSNTLTKVSGKKLILQIADIVKKALEYLQSQQTRCDYKGLESVHLVEYGSESVYVMFFLIKATDTLNENKYATVE